MKRLKNSKKEVIYKGKFLSYIVKGGWEYIERNNCDGIVIILAMTKDKKVIFIEQYRPPVSKKVIEFPAGLVNDFEQNGLKRKETLLQAAKRELLEETGYAAKRMNQIFKGPINCGISSDLVTFVRAINIQKVSAGGGDETEEIKVHAIGIEKAEAWFKKKEKEGYLIGPRLYAGLYFLNKYNK